MVKTFEQVFLNDCLARLREGIELGDKEKIKIMYKNLRHDETPPETISKEDLFELIKERRPLVKESEIHDIDAFDNNHISCLSRSLISLRTALASSSW